jgi:hypothetical protein
MLLGRQRGYALRDVAVPSIPAHTWRLIEEVVAIACRCFRVLVYGNCNRLNVQKAVALPVRQTADLGKGLEPPVGLGSSKKYL